MKDIVELLVELSTANKTIEKQENIIAEYKEVIVEYKELINRKDEKIQQLVHKSRCLSADLEMSKNSGANLLIQKIIDDISESGLIRIEVEE